jgi:hypothetical protein
MLNQRVWKNNKARCQMNHLRLTALVVAFLPLGACEGLSATEMPEIPTIISVQTLTEDECSFRNGVVPINIIYNDRDKDIVVAPPEPVVAHPGQFLQFNLVGKNGVLVSTSGKTPKDGWLNGSGKRKNGNAASFQFFVCVRTDLFPDGAEPGDELEFEYNVNAVGHTTLDPIVVVRRL